MFWPEDPRSKIQDLAGEGGGGGATLPDKRKMAKYTKIQNPESGMPTEGTASHLMKGCI